jgi:acyl carrier protein
MMTIDSIATVLADYLHSSPAVAGSIDRETDLIESGWLDSILVMDLVCFLEARFQCRMQPTDISPRNLRSVRCLAHYVHERLSCSANAA